MACHFIVELWHGQFVREIPLDCLRDHKFVCIVLDIIPLILLEIFAQTKGKSKFSTQFGVEPSALMFSIAYVPGWNFVLTSSHPDVLGKVFWQNQLIVLSVVNPRWTCVRYYVHLRSNDGLIVTNLCYCNICTSHKWASTVNFTSKNAGNIVLNIKCMISDNSLMWN